MEYFMFIDFIHNFFILCVSLSLWKLYFWIWYNSFLQDKKIPYIASVLHILKQALLKIHLQRKVAKNDYGNTEEIIIL